VFSDLVQVESPTLRDVQEAILVCDQYNAMLVRGKKAWPPPIFYLMLVETN